MGLKGGEGHVVIGSIKISLFSRPRVKVSPGQVFLLEAGHPCRHWRS